MRALLAFAGVATAFGSPGLALYVAYSNASAVSPLSPIVTGETIILVLIGTISIAWTLYHEKKVAESFFFALSTPLLIVTLMNLPVVLNCKIGGACPGTASIVGAADASATNAKE